ncbi:SHOCT domain-containing protein [Arthrobacter sp. 9MFCol3.1]|uniref:SHOCT domain-containing protein n=1 Tax=Arthrobacter sp. 9MFCol3.1 TaxID=1150398 RepID=UPI000B1491B7|nr:SHOCT domain-containing protein [Arthrobacter sp. 9MFCol3.1]
MGLLRGVARTAVVAGTASAVSGRVQRRQANKFAEKDAATAAKQQEAYDAQMAQQQPPPQEYQQPVYQQAPPPPPPAAGGISNEALEQLKQLGALKEQGILTEEEFAAQKAKVLGT